MNVVGNTKLFINVIGKGRNSFISSSIMISAKKGDEFVNSFLKCQFSKKLSETLGIDGLEESVSYKIKLEDGDAWLSCYEGKNGTETFLFINDLTIIEDKKNNKRK